MSSLTKCKNGRVFNRFVNSLSKKIVADLDDYSQAIMIKRDKNMEIWLDTCDRYCVCVGIAKEGFPMQRCAEINLESVTVGPDFLRTG